MTNDLTLNVRSAPVSTCESNRSFILPEVSTPDTRFGDLSFRTSLPFHSLKPLERSYAPPQSIAVLDGMPDSIIRATFDDGVKEGLASDNFVVGFGMTG